MSMPLKWYLVAALIVILGVLIVLDVVLGLHAQVLSALISSLAFFGTKSLEACLVYVSIYVLVSLICLPLTPFEIFTGFCFGFPFGILLDMVGRMSGAAISFGIARALARKGLDCPFLKGHAVLRGIGQAVEEQGLRFLLLFNLAYVPVAVKNYGLGFVPEVPLLLFLQSIFIVEIPLATIWAFIGNVIAADLTKNGVSLTNTTAVYAALVDGPGRGGWQLKCGLLALGLGSIVLLMHVLGKKVSAQLTQIRANERREQGIAMPVTPPSAGVTPFGSAIALGHTQ